MARVTLTTYADYAARNASVINAMWTAFQTQSTNIDAENVRDEGLDQRNIAASSAVDGFDIKGYTGNTETFSSGGAYPTWSDLTFTTPATAMSINNGGSGWAVGTGVGQVWVRFSAEFSFDLGARTTDFQFSPVWWRLVYVDNTGTITPSVMTAQHGLWSTVSIGTTAPNADLRYMRGRTAFCYLIPNAGGRTSVSSIKVQWAIETAGAANVTFGHCELTAKRYVKPS